MGNRIFEETPKEFEYEDIRTMDLGGQVNIAKLLAPWEGRDIPVEWKSWFELARAAKKTQKHILEDRESIRDLERTLGYTKVSLKYQEEAYEQMVGYLHKLVPAVTRTDVADGDLPKDL